MEELLMYSTEHEQVPMGEFLDTLDPKLKSKVMRNIELLEEFGITLSMPHARHLSQELWELRIKFSTHNIRVLYFIENGGRIILLNGFMKKDQRTPQSEVDKAKRYIRDWKKRHHDKE